MYMAVTALSTKRIHGRGGTAEKAATQKGESEGEGRRRNGMDMRGVAVAYAQAHMAAALHMPYAAWASPPPFCLGQTMVTSRSGD